MSLWRVRKKRGEEEPVYLGISLLYLINENSGLKKEKAGKKAAKEVRRREGNTL